MERTKPPIKKSRLTLPDAINCQAKKEFTQIPNALLRNPNITGKSKAILCLLLSNRSGWHSWISTIEKMMAEKRDAIESGLRELEAHGYLKRVKFRDAKTKKWIGSFWAYTDSPNQLDISEHLAELERNGLEVPGMTNHPNDKEKPDPAFPGMAEPGMAEPDLANPHLKILKNKNTKYRKDQFGEFLELFPNWKESESFQQSLKSYFIHRHQKGTITIEAGNRLASKLKKYSIQEAINALDRSTENGWTGVFPENPGFTSKPIKPDPTQAAPGKYSHVPVEVIHLT